MGVLLVTGGSRGIGAAIAKLAAKKSYDVCVNYVRARERADEVAAAVRAEGRRALVVQADVVRYRPLLLVLAAGKMASSLAALGFYVFDQDVFIYLLNFLVDGFLAAVALLLWSVAGRIGEPAAPS